MIISQHCEKKELLVCEHIHEQQQGKSSLEGESTMVFCREKRRRTKKPNGRIGGSFAFSQETRGVAASNNTVSNFSSASPIDCRRVRCCLRDLCFSVLSHNVVFQRVNS